MDEDDLFADLYDGENEDPQPTAAVPVPAQATPALEAPKQVQQPEAAAVPTPADTAQPDANLASLQYAGGNDEQSQSFEASHEDAAAEAPVDPRDRPVLLKEDGKMFVGGLNWETTDESLKAHFSQWGKVVDCQVMRDGNTGRSRGFGFLTYEDPSIVTEVCLKEHFLDGKMIDPKRAIPREEQEKTSKIFVGGVSQDCTDADFKQYFRQFGRVLDATLMLDKNNGRPRGFGFVTFDNDKAVDAALASDLIIKGKPIEVKRAEPRNAGPGGDDEGRGGNRFSRGGGHNSYGRDNNAAQQQQAQAPANNMSQAQVAALMMNMQRMMQMAQQQNAMQNPAMMQQMMAMQNPAMMQQMMAMQQGQGQFQGMPQSNTPVNGNGGFQNMPQSGSLANSNGQEQAGFDRQQTRMQQNNYNQGQTWDGFYEDTPPPNRGGRGGRGGGQPLNAPAGAPTGPRNAGRPGSNYRGGGRGGNRGYHPYNRQNAG